MIAKLSSEEGAKIGSDLLDSIQTSLNDLDCSKLGESDIANEVNGKFQISISHPVPEFSNEFVDAYEAYSLGGDSEEGDTQTSGQFYALVFKKNMPFRLAEIIKLQSATIANMYAPIETGVTVIGNGDEKFFVAIMPWPQGKTLSKLISEEEGIDDNFILNSLVEPIISTLNNIHQSGIAHGNINPDNIYLNSEGKAFLGECISTLCGYEQITFYETVERAQAHPCSKGTASPADDYYAFGMTLFTLSTKKQLDKKDDATILTSKLSQSTFSFLNNSSLLTGTLGDLIKGLVADHKDIRWSYTEVDNVLQGKKYTISAADLSSLSRAIVFNDKEYYSKRSLAYELSTHPEEAKEFIKQDKIKKWLETSTSEEKTIELLSALASSMQRRSGAQKLIDKDDENLCKLLMVLDPDGPIRIGGISFHRGGMGPLLAHSIVTGHTDTTQTIANTIFANIYEFYEEISSKYQNKEYSKGLLVINKCSEYLRKSDIGFGIERCLYDLNPSLPCQSNLFKNIFAVGLKDVIQYIEDSAFTFEDLISKKSLSCFIASKANLLSEIRVADLNKYPILQKSRVYQMLSLFSSAQKKTKIAQLPNTAEAFRVTLQDVLDSVLQSKTIKNTFYEKINTAAKTGDLNKLLSASAKPNYLNQDTEGYGDALRRGAEIAREIFSFSNKEAMSGEVKRRSLKFAVKFSYILSGFLIISIVLKSL